MWQYILLGFVLGFFLAVEIYRSDWFSRKRKDEYYDEFLYELSLLDDEGFEKLLDQFKKTHKIFKKSDIF